MQPPNRLFFLILSWGYVLKNDSRIICRCGIIRLPHGVRVDQDHEAMLHDIIRLPHGVRVDHEHEKWINFRNKTENVKSFKSFLQEREPYG